MAAAGNNIQPDGAIGLAAGLRRNRSIITLNVNCAEILPEGAAAILQAAIPNPTLRSLSLGGNKVLCR